MFANIPRVGMRMVKTALAVAVCFLLYFLRGEEGVPIFSTIAAIICMQPYTENSIQVAINRIFATLLGAVFALLVLHLIRYIPYEVRILRYMVISFAVIPVMYVTVLLKRTGASALSGIVLLSVCLSNVGYTPLEGAINRSVETIIGILVSLGVNNLHLPRRKTGDFLFVTGFDGALYDEKSGISPYASFELNQLLQDGLPFTIATERTPASLMADLKGLDLHLPVIAMDGAVLYDVKDKRYRATNGLPKEWVDLICAHVKGKEYHYFLNVVWQNVLLIYFSEFKNEVERELYLSNRRSPYRNYIYGEMPEDGVVVYILLVLRDAEADALEAELCAMDAERELLFLRDKSETPADYCHLKIYHKNATKECMLKRLMEEIPQKKCVAFGSNKNDLSMLAAAQLSYATADAVPEACAAAKRQLRGHGGDSIVRKIFRLYERLPWEKLPKEMREPKD
nr:HAD hydrolase family protein [uncultured Anaerotignum sp.]